MWTRAKDISQWQGNWQDTGEEIVLIKCGGGDKGLYYDPKCTENYNGAVADNRAVGLYWFIGWSAGPEAEAAFMLRAVSPLAENDVYALDIENGANPIPANAVQYVAGMVDFIHDHTGVWPLLYMNLATLNAFDWSPVLANCGLWLADWAVSPDANIPTHYTYVMQQYSDGPNYDHDAFFGSVDQFKAYGYHAPQPAPEPTPPVAQPQPEPPAVQPEPVPAPVVEPQSPPSPDTQPTIPQKPQTSSPSLPVGWFQAIINFLLSIFKRKAGRG